MMEAKMPRIKLPCGCTTNLVRGTLLNLLLFFKQYFLWDLVHGKLEGKRDGK